MCRKTKLSYQDMELMDVGMAIDYIDEFNQFNNNESNSESKPRKATQADIEALKGR